MIVADVDAVLLAFIPFVFDAGCLARGLNQGLLVALGRANGVKIGMGPPVVHATCKARPIGLPVSFDVRDFHADTGERVTRVKLHEKVSRL